MYEVEGAASYAEEPCNPTFREVKLRLKGVGESASENIILYSPSPFNKGTAFVPAGTYQLEAARLEFGWSTQFGCTYPIPNNPEVYDFKIKVEKNLENPIIGGLRVKSVTKKNLNGSTLTQKYNYAKFEDSSVSSGLRVNPPNYSYYTLEDIDIPGDPSDFDPLLGTLPGQVWNYGSVNNNRMNCTRNSEIMYSNIEVETLGNDGLEPLSSFDLIGRTQYEFSFDPNIFLVNNYPFLSRAWEDWRIGNISRISYLSGQGDLVRELKHAYANVPPVLDDIRNFSVGLWIEYEFDQDQVNWPPIGIKHKLSSSVSEHYYVERIDDTYYDESLIPYTTTQEFYYEGQNPFSLSKVKTTHPDGTILLTKNKYSADYFVDTETSEDVSNTIQELMASGINNAPIETSNYLVVNGEEKLLNSTINFYEKCQNEDLVPILKYQRSTSLSAPLENYEMSHLGSSSQGYPFDFEEELFDIESNRVTECDTYSTPIEFANENDIYSSVLQSENGLYASMANISNGHLSSSRYTSFEEVDFHGGWGLSSDLANIKDITDLSSGPTYAPSGNKVYQLDGSSSAQFNSKPTNQDKFPIGEYLLSYYAYGNGVVVSPGDQHDTPVEVQKGEWTYIEVPFRCTDPEGCWVTVGGTGYVDEIRVHELDASMTTMGYYPDGQTMYEGDAVGNIVNYEYDSKNRLLWVLDEEYHVIEHHHYIEKDDANSQPHHIHTVYTSKKEGLSKTGYTDQPSSKVGVSSSFYDGWGRHLQTQSLDVHNNASDIVSVTEYDAFGRVLKEHLPYSTSLAQSQTYISDPETEQLNYYASRDDDNESTTFPYVTTTLENSPLQRPVSQSGIGESYTEGSGHETTTTYGWNETTDQIVKWNFNDGGMWANSYSSSNDANYYPPGELRKTTVVNPNGQTSVSFTDARGREVATGGLIKLAQGATGTAYTGSIDLENVQTKMVLTYYVYDDWGRVRFIIPPKAIEQMASNNHTYYVSDWDWGHANHHMEFITAFRYDDHGRVSHEKRPGEGRLRHFFYDKKDRLALTHLPSDDDFTYTFYKYDNQNRTVLTGQVVLTGTGQQALIDESNLAIDVERIGTSGSNDIFGYSNTTYPVVSEDDVDQVFYFDDYQFVVENHCQFSPFEDGDPMSHHTRFLPTGSLTRTLPVQETLGDMLMTVSYYDDERRMLQSITENHMGGWDRISHIYNDRGQMIKSLQHHLYEEDSDPIQIKTDYTYYHTTGEAKGVRHQINEDQGVWISHRSYDELGTLKELNLHKRQAVNYLQSIDYRYNDQGQLTHINNPSLIVDAYNSEDDDVFGQELMYHKRSDEVMWNTGAVQYCEGSPGFTADYSGQIGGMIWNAKTPETDGATTNRHLYTYRYDDFGQLIKAEYAADAPENPGVFEVDYGRYSTGYNYDLGGNITRLQRRNRNYCEYSRTDEEEESSGLQPVSDLMDDLTYTYLDDGFKLDRVDESTHGDAAYNPSLSHFTETSSAPNEYQYDPAGRNIVDLNKGISLNYNKIGNIDQVDHTSTVQIRYLYDVVGNKLSKSIRDPQNPDLDSHIDYIGNFVYENGELKMIYHPEGVIRPRGEDDDNPNEFVYDYFVKDYLGNVRVVVTEEDETEEIIRFLATMEEVHAQLEERNFENIPDTREDLPQNYPVDGSAQLNEQIAYLIADGEMAMGPSLVRPVRVGEKLSVSVDYFYEEDAPGATYDNLGFLVDEILVALASSAAGVIPISEGALSNIASGHTPLHNQLYQFIDHHIDTNTVGHPHAYLVYMAFDNRNRLVPGNSGVIQVSDPNQLRTILTNEIVVKQDGYMHTYVSNGSSNRGVSFNDFMMTAVTGKTRQINHYYPYGLPLPEINEIRTDYLNKYTGKEHQTREYEERGLQAKGLEMFDFHARFWEPQLARWTSPDPAMQFPNPYLGIGNNPVMYVDPDGEFVWAPILIGAAIGGTLNWAFNGAQFNAEGLGYFGVGALAGAAGGVAGQAIAGAVGTVGFAGGALTGGGAGFAGGFVSGAGNAWVGGANFGDGLVSGLRTGAIGGLTGGVIGGVTGGINAVEHGGDFWSGKGATFDALALPGNPAAVGDDLEYSNEYAKEFSDEHFGKVKGLNDLHADGSVPEGYTVKGDQVLNTAGRPVRASTAYLGTGKGSDVFLYKAAFSSREQLYLTMGHEYLHVGYFQTGFMDFERQHAAISKWELQQSKLWKYNNRFYQTRFTIRTNGIKPYNLTTNPNYIPPISIKPWLY